MKKEKVHYIRQMETRESILETARNRGYVSDLAAACDQNHNTCMKKEFLLSSHSNCQSTSVE